MESFDLVCPEGVNEGENIRVEAGGRYFDVILPLGVSPGDHFQIHVDRMSGFQAIAARIEQAREITTEFLGIPGAEPKEVTGGEVLAEALRSILQELEYNDELDDLIDGNSDVFAEFSIDGEQRLEWTELFIRYVKLVEESIAGQLTKLDCSAEDVLEYAKLFGNETTANRLLAKFIALDDYTAFCNMMKRAHTTGPMKV